VVDSLTTRETKDVTSITTSYNVRLGWAFRVVERINAHPFHRHLLLLPSVPPGPNKKPSRWEREGFLEWFALTRGRRLPAGSLLGLQQITAELVHSPHPGLAIVHQVQSFVDRVHGHIDGIIEIRAQRR